MNNLKAGVDQSEQSLNNVPQTVNGEFMTNTISAYRVKWHCLKLGAKKNVPKYATKGTNAMVIGNVLLTTSEVELLRVGKNISGTKCERGVRKFIITDKQFGLISLTNLNYHGWTFEDVERMKKCKIPQLVVNNNGKLALIPVTNIQFMGAPFTRKSLFL
jgi:hypothetical protein